MSILCTILNKTHFVFFIYLFILPISILAKLKQMTFPHFAACLHVARRKDKSRSGASEREKEREWDIENLRRHKVMWLPSFLGDSSSVIHWDARLLSWGQIRHLAAGAAAAAAVVGCVSPPRQVLSLPAEVSLIPRPLTPAGFKAICWPINLFYATCFP